MEAGPATENIVFRIPKADRERLKAAAHYRFMHLEDRGMAADNVSEYLRLLIKADETLIQTEIAQRRGA